MNLALRIIIWFASLLGIAAAVMASFLWLDRPVALFVHDHFRYPHRGVVDELSHFPNPLILLAVVLSVILRPADDSWSALFTASGQYVRLQLECHLYRSNKECMLKFIFGRTWPETWVHNNPSFIRDGIYGFHFMHGGSAYQSFPSGHMAATCTVISVLWIRYPHFRWFYLIVGLFVGTALVGANYHFLSDVIAGAFVGASSGWMATVIWDACATRRMAPRS